MIVGGCPALALFILNANAMQAVPGFPLQSLPAAKA